MTIEEYKEAIIGLVKKMEEEHGCDIHSVEVGTDKDVIMPYNMEKKYYRVIIRT